MLHNKNLILEFKRNAATAILSIASISLIVTILFLFSLMERHPQVWRVILLDSFALLLALYSLLRIKKSLSHYNIWLFGNFFLWTIIIFLAKIYHINDFVLIWYPPLILSFMIIADPKPALIVTITALLFTLFATVDLPLRNIFSIFMALVGSALFGYMINRSLQNFTKQNEELKDHFYKLSIQDYLTKLPNRKYFFDEAKKILSLAKRKRFPISLLTIDIDHFKHINDRYGHLKGDEVLITFADMLKTNIRAYDLAARVGGEEFVILIPGESPQKVVHIAERIRHNVKELHIEPNIHFTVSIGIYCSDKKYDIKQLLAKSDQALYEAKRQGRDRIVLHEEH